VATASSTLNLSIYSCKTQTADTAYDVQVFKDGEFYKNIHLSYFSQFDTTLSDIQRGVYFFKFANIYNQLITDTLVISKDTVYWKSLCSDDYILNSPFRGHVDSLKNTDFFSIEFESYGCYHWEVQKLKVFKKDNQYFSTLYPTKKIREHRTEKVITKTIKLTDKQLDLISSFQFDTYKNATGYPGSTEITYYTFKYKKNQLKFVDSQEARDRFESLVKILYSKSK
jgi:hypothetical protein